MTHPLLEVKALKVVYESKGAATIIGPVAFEIFEGESFGLIGESGAGKSTIGLEILGLLHFKGGRRLWGSVFSPIPQEQMAYIPQDPLSAIDPLFSIGNQLREISPDTKRIEQVLEQVHLPLNRISLKSYPHELSGGMRQRLVIAMALLKRPKLIVADEPTSSLDLTLQAEIMALFREIRKTGVSFLFITHNLPLAASFCDRVAIMKLGKIIETGKPADLFRHPETAYTRELVESIPRMKL